MRRKLILPESALEDVSQLISLSEDQLSKLCNLLDSQYAADEEFGDLLLQVGEELNVSNEAAFTLINAVNNLVAQKRNFKIKDEDLIAELQLLIKHMNSELIEEIDTKKDLISKLIGPKQKAEHYDKVRFLQTGLINTAKGFKSICDIRPVFNEDRTKIVDLIPIIIFEVEFEKGDLKSSPSVVFQLNEKSFQSLKDSTKYIEKKLDVIKSFIKSNKGEKENV